MPDGPELRDALSWTRYLATLAPNPVPPLPSIDDALSGALRHPIGLDRPLLSRFRRGDTVAVVVPDASRRAGTDRFLPGLVRALETAGIRDTDIAFHIALGVHRPATPAEKSAILGPDLYARFYERCFNHDAYDDKGLLHFGRTARGTEVYLNRQACETDHLVLTGSVVPHYFAGFGGGRKALVPGLAGAATIAHNHALNLHPREPRLNPDVRIGVLDGNPVAEDLLEAARFRPPDFIVNTVLAADGGIAGLFAGEMNAAHRAACDQAAKTFCVAISEPADLVVAAIAGAPNFVQSHKALVNAHAAMKPGGCIVLMAPAPEGLGGSGYRRYLEMGSPDKVIAALRAQADINGQTALSTLQKAPHTILVTDMSGEDVNLLGARKAPTLTAALDLARNHFAGRGVAQPACYVMPEAGVTVPVLPWA